MPSSDDDLAFASAGDQARLLRDGEICARDLVELYLRRIEALDGDLGSYVEVLADRARGDADDADARTVSDEPTGPLHGVPISVKDTNLLAGARTTSGTRAAPPVIPEVDDHAVARLLHAGAIPLGKTNVSEFGSIGHTDTGLLGPCSTPWEPGRNAGGSSGGAGAALAAGLCALSQGSDGAGSVRIPAAVNGVVGLKPARDRVSAGPLVGESAFGLSTVGGLSRSVDDAALVLDVLAGYELGDPGKAPPPLRSWRDELTAPVGRLRIGVCNQAPFTPDGLHASVTVALEHTTALLERLGHAVEEVDIPLGEGFVDLVLTLWAANIAAQPFDASAYEPVNAWLAGIGHTRTAAQYASAQFQLQLQLRGLVARTFHLDALMLPVLTGPTRRNGHYAGWDGEAVFRDQAALVGLTPLANLTGQPAISLPLHHDPEVGPVGVQFVGRPWDEAGLLRLAAQLEDAAGWHDRRPPGSALPPP